MIIDPDELLNRQLRLGTHYVQCAVHQDLDISLRPGNCVLCQADIRRTMIRVMEINIFLNTWRNDATYLINQLKR